MGLKQTLLIVNSEQFGYHVDTLKYCENLAGLYSIIYLCWDHGLEKIEKEHVDVVYVSRTGNFFSRTLRFINQFKQHQRRRRTIVFIVYFKVMATFLKLFFPSNVFVLDVRTGHVKGSGLIRYLMDQLILLESMMFRHVTIISDDLATKLGIKNYTVVPLGGELIPRQELDFKDLALVYSGTLKNRNIHQVIDGVALYLRTCQPSQTLRFDVFGRGTEDDLNLIRERIRVNHLEAVVTLHGYVENSKVLRYISDCSNIGVSYIPMTSYFDHQPPTKTFEYLLCGIPVIATGTQANIEVINDSNGVIVSDTPESFAQGLAQVVARTGQYHTEGIQSSLRQFSWQNISLDLHKVLSKLH